MVDRDRALRPLSEAESAIERLGAYETSAELAESLIHVWGAVERSLRYLLRTDAGAPDDVRLAALSPKDLPTDHLLAALRRRERISLHLAGRVHELERAAARAASGKVQASDADLGLGVARDLAAAIAAPDAGAAATPAPPSPEPEAQPDDAGPSWEAGRAWDALRGRAVLVAGLALAGVVVVLLARQLSGPSNMEEGIAAFQQGRLGLAEQHFRAAVQSDEEDVTARLYLGRVFRREGRFEEAAGTLRMAASQAPADADVRRELGHLFMDLGQPESAAKQYRQAQELEPEDRLNWLGLIRSLRAAGDREAEEVLRRAPADVRAALDSAAA